MDIDLKDSKTKALFDYFSENNPEDFEGAYYYMKYLHEFISIISQGLGNPPIAELEKLKPEVLQKLYAKVGMIASGFGSYETSMYHAKLIKLEDAEKLVTQPLDLHLDVPETIVPYKMAKDVILNNPDSIAIGRCPCRNANPESSCMPEPMEACMFLGDPFASFVVEHNPQIQEK